MFRKWKLKKAVKNCKKNIQKLENQRSRSQAALVEAILSNTTPTDEDVDYFNKYTALINSERDSMHAFMEELKKLG